MDRHQKMSVLIFENLFSLILVITSQCQNFSTKSHSLFSPVVLIELLSNGLMPGIVLSSISVKFTFAFAKYFA